MLCAVCTTVHEETRSTGFLVEPQNQGQRFASGLASKPVVNSFLCFGLKTGGISFLRFGLKPMATVFSGLASKSVATVFSDLASKSVATISPSLVSKPVVRFLVEPQNPGGGGFPGLGLKTGSYGLVIWASKSPQWFLGLCLKTMWAMVCCLRLKPNGRMR
jgi:hypothetical protein